MKSEVPSIHQYLSTLRKDLSDQKVIVPQGPHDVFADDHAFESPSTAAGVVLGRSANGRIEWKDKDGKTLKEIQTAAAGENGRGRVGDRDDEEHRTAPPSDATLSFRLNVPCLAPPQDQGRRFVRPSSFGSFEMIATPTGPPTSVNYRWHDHLGKSPVTRSGKGLRTILPNASQLTRHPS